MFYTRLISFVQIPLRRAIGESLLATSLCGIILGIIFLPREIERFQTKPAETVLFSESAAQGRVLFSIVDSIQMQKAKGAHRNLLMRCDISETVQTFPRCKKLEPQCICLDPLHDRLLLVDTKGGLYADHLHSAGTTPFFLGQVSSDFCRGISCTLDGLTLVVHNCHALSAWNIGLKEMQSPKTLWSLADENIHCFELAPADDQVFFGRTSDFPHCKNELFEVNLQNRESRLLFDNFVNKLVVLAISPNRRFMVCVESDGKVTLLERESNSQPWQHRSVPGLCTGTTAVVSISPDSETLITSDRENARLVAWDLVRREKRSQFETQPTKLIGCSFMNEKEVVSWSSGVVLNVWNLETSTLDREINLLP